MMQMLKHPAIKWSSVLAVVGVLVNAGYSYSQDLKAERFVAGIEGEHLGKYIFYDEPIDGAWGFIEIAWAKQYNDPPQCPAKIVSTWKHESGRSISDTAEPTYIPADFIQAVHHANNGNIGEEPIYSRKVVELLKAHPGEWSYRIEWHFNCSLVKGEWVSFLVYDRIHITDPVIINIK